jgi:menaquinone-dependent protoporphyrinogen oxidase
MKPILVLYATRDGQTRHIAERVSSVLRTSGIPVQLLNAAELHEPFSLDAFCGAVLAASIHLGHHEKELVSWVKRHKDALAQLPCAFLSVSLSEATVEGADRPPEARARATADVQRMLEDFFKETGWRPRVAMPVAGALVYSKYNFLVRWVMKMIARHNGASTDTSRDYEFTDWQALERFARTFGQDVAQPPP